MGLRFGLKGAPIGLRLELLRGPRPGLKGLTIICTSRLCPMEPKLESKELLTGFCRPIFEPKRLLIGLYGPIFELAEILIGLFGTKELAIELVCPRFELKD